MNRNSKRNSRTKQQADENSRCPGIIEPDVLYTLQEFRDRSRLSESAYKSAKQTGLKTRKAGKRVYVLGSDFIEWVKQDTTYQTERGLASDE